MTTTATTTTWRALHLYCHDTAAQDRLVIALAEELDPTGVPWFFVRYWLGGPHLRVRVDDPDGAVIARVRRTGERFFAEAHVPDLVRDEHYARIPSALREGHDDERLLPWFSSGVIRDEPYAPEYDRYGGADAMPMAERAFVASSALSVGVIRSTRTPTARLAAAATVMSGFAERLGIAGRLVRYGRFWIDAGAPQVPADVVQRVAELGRRAVLPDALEGELERVTACVRPLASDGADDRAILVLASQIHMTNNRLGVPVVWEGLIAQELWGSGRP